MGGTQGPYGQVWRRQNLYPHQLAKLRTIQHVAGLYNDYVTPEPHKCVQSNVPQTSSLADPFWLQKITTDPHILAHVNREYVKLNIYISDLILDRQ
jgi:hypothetical protein